VVLPGIYRIEFIVDAYLSEVSDSGLTLYGVKNHIFILPMPENRDGFTFLCWYNYDNDFIYEDRKIITDKDTVVAGFWDVKSYTVTIGCNLSITYSSYERCNEESFQVIHGSILMVKPSGNYTHNDTVLPNDFRLENAELIEGSNQEYAYFKVTGDATFPGLNNIAYCYENGKIIKEVTVTNGKDYTVMSCDELSVDFEGCSFIGWFDSEENHILQIDSVKSDYILYAKCN
jgi:hypothetical protein